LRAIVAVVGFAALLVTGTPALAAEPGAGSAGSPGKAHKGGFRAAPVAGQNGAQVLPDPDGEPPGCNASVVGSANPTLIRVPQPPGVPDELVGVSYLNAWGEWECFGLVSLSAQARIVDRTPGYDGLVLANGNLVVRSGGATGGISASSADAAVYDEWQDNGRVVEGILDLTLRLRGGYTWQYCSPPPGNRLLLCAGVGTTTLHAVLGTYPFSAGLKPPVLRYVALGDSYASGMNADAYDANSIPGECYRSANAYGRRLTGLYRGSIQIQPPMFRACAGAVIADMTGTQLGSEGPQINAVNPYSTRLVTVQIGGNDLGFAEVLKGCILENRPCVYPVVAPALMQQTQTRLTALYRQILSRMRSDATLVVLTYPAVIPRPGDPTCPSIDLVMTTVELGALDEAWGRARQMIISAASAVGDPRIRILDLYDAFEGHKICSSSEWASIDLVHPSRSFHPNAAGHRVIAQRLQAALGLIGVIT
jgi:lysophospholipase L1-like esterase